MHWLNGSTLGICYRITHGSGSRISISSGHRFTDQQQIIQSSTRKCFIRQIKSIISPFHEQFSSIFIFHRLNNVKNSLIQWFSHINRLRHNNSSSSILRFYFKPRIVEILHRREISDNNFEIINKQIVNYVFIYSKIPINAKD